MKTIEEIAKEIINNGGYDAIVEIMDDDLREEIHNDLAPCTDLEFLTEYIKRHEEKFKEAFPPKEW